MAIKIIKLLTKESLIGEIETDTIDFTELVVLHDPMVVDLFANEQDETIIRLRSAVSLSEEDFLIFQPKHILTFYTPPGIMVEYYEKIRKHLRADKSYVSEMIKEAIVDLEEDQSDDSIFATLKDKNHMH